MRAWIQPKATPAYYVPSLSTSRPTCGVLSGSSDSFISSITYYCVLARLSPLHELNCFGGKKRTELVSSQLCL